MTGPAMRLRIDTPILIGLVFIALPFA